MSRRHRREYPGAVHHVTARGNRGEPIYLDDVDRRAFLDLLGETVERFQWLCHAYCLMGNHYHLMVETPLANLGRGMRHLGGVYTQRFNRRHKRAGHVFQGRYTAILVEKERHLLELSRYVVLNPVRAGLAPEAGSWPWSSYLATAALAPAPPYLHTAWLHSLMGQDGTSSVRAYRDFVAEGGGPSMRWRRAAVAGVMGGAAFQGEVRSRGPESGAEPPRQARRLARPALADLRRGQDERGAWMTEAYREHGYTMSEIGAEAGLHYSSVSKILKGVRS